MNSKLFPALDPLEEQVYAQVRRQGPHLRHLRLTPATTLADDLGLDHVERRQFGMQLEQDLRLDIPDTELGQWRTLADLLACVRRLLPAPPVTPC